MLSLLLNLATLGQSSLSEAQLIKNVAPKELTWGTFEEIKSHASLTTDDLRFQSLDWKTTVFEGLKYGQELDKPVILWLYFGDPRGAC